jgi:hypothetical protein
MLPMVTAEEIEVPFNLLSVIAWADDRWPSSGSPGEIIAPLTAPTVAR